MPTYKTKHPIEIKSFRGGSNLPYADFTLPAGLRCKAISEGGTAGKFFLNELPLDLFPANSCIRHDAEYYGITLDAEDIETTPDPLPADWGTNKLLTPDALEAAAATAQVPYATAQLAGRLLTLYLSLNGTYSVFYGPTATGMLVYAGPDALMAIDAFKSFKPETLPS